MIVVNSDAIVTIISSSNAITMILIMTVINGVGPANWCSPVYGKPNSYHHNGGGIQRCQDGSPHRHHHHDNATTYPNRHNYLEQRRENDSGKKKCYGHLIIMTVMNGVVVRPMDVTLFIVSLTSITMVGVAVRGGMMVVLTDITILGMLLSI